MVPSSTDKPDFPISGEILEKANEFVGLLGHYDKDEVISMSWVNRWKARHLVVSKRLVGEAASVDMEIVDEWVRVKIPLLLQNFPTNNIFNVDEMGLFWRLMPSQTLAFKREEVRGSKHPKDRVTVLVGSSMSGEKLPLLVIGRSH